MPYRKRRMIRKMRYRKRRSSMRVRMRRARRGVFAMRSQRPYTEVKYADIANIGKGIMIDSTATGTCKLQNIFMTNLLNAIAVGTGRNQRIGSSIYVKKIVLKIHAQTCGFLLNTTQYYSNTVLFRVSVTDAPQGATYSDIPQYFGNVTASQNKIITPLNRRTYIVKYDKTHKIQEGFANLSPSTNASFFGGAQKLITITLPVNRTVEFNDDNMVKESINYFTVVGHAGVPNYIYCDTKVPLCIDAFARVYYTDT